MEPTKQGLRQSGFAIRIRKHDEQIKKLQEAIKNPCNHYRVIELILILQLLAIVAGVALLRH